MDKVFEALNYLYNDLRLMKCLDVGEEAKIKSAYKCLYQAITKLQSILQAESSEALECLEEIIHCYNEPQYELGGYSYKNELLENCEKEVNTIKNYILKAQADEKDLIFFNKIKTMLKQKEAVVRYIESEDCFATKTILSDRWYKITPQFVDDNIREEIEPLPVLGKIKQLKEENAEYKKILEIIKEKGYEGYELAEFGTFEAYKKNMDKIYADQFVIDWNDKEQLVELRLYNEEEFCLLKNKALIK